MMEVTPMLMVDHGKHTTLFIDNDHIKVCTTILLNERFQLIEEISSNGFTSMHILDTLPI